MNYYLAVLKKYAVFSGRSRRAEYWYFCLFHFLIYIAISFVNISLGIKINFLGLVYSLAGFLPAIGVLIRRLHDVGKSGWMYFIVLIPFVGPIWLIVLLATDSDRGDNKYGPNPKGVLAS